MRTTDLLPGARTPETARGAAGASDYAEDGGEMRPIVCLAAVLVVAAGCAKSSQPIISATAASVPSPYAGPMHLPISSDDDKSVLSQFGAAGQALECTYPPYAGGAVDYRDGLETVQDSYTDALAQVVNPTGTGEYIPASGYRVERDDGDRALLSWDAANRTEVAFIAYDEIKDYTGDSGWGIESWAMCDPAEFPTDVTDGMGIGFWYDRQGARVPIAQVLSYPGNWCEIGDTRMFQVGQGRAAVNYLQDTGGQASEYLRSAFSADATLPETVTDTGFNNGDRELWLAADRNAAYLVSRDDATDVQRWPAIKPGIGCG